MRIRKVQKNMMKYVVYGLTALAILTGCEKQSPEFTQIELNAGVVRVYDFGEYKLHNYDTMDSLGVQVYVLETPTNLIGIEGPAFATNIYAWRDYIKTLKKPLDAILTSYHPNGGYWQWRAKNYATEQSIASRKTGSLHYKIREKKAQFGRPFLKTIIPIDKVIPNGKQEIAGTEFIITDKGDGYTIEIPAINVIYVHKLGADTHSILQTPEHIDEHIKQLKQYRRAHYDMILSAHHMPETAYALTQKIRYLYKTKRIYKNSTDATEFTDKMHATFPKLNGENYLEISAKNLFE